MQYHPWAEFRLAQFHPSDDSFSEIEVLRTAAYPDLPLPFLHRVTKYGS